MHKKEKIIAPLLKQELRLDVVVPPDFNTDVFGTFTREVHRPGTQVEAARLKAEKAIAMTGESLAIASEGSFFPHPRLPFIPANKEIVILLDKKNDLEIIGEEFSTDTNYSHQMVESVEEAFDFANKVGFPEHGLIVSLSSSPKDSSEIIKGIVTEQKLEEVVSFFLESSPNKKAHIETDMRAMYNPTRMKSIEKATRNLLYKINSCCPRCSTPGFEISQRIPGLPCAGCYTPTLLILAVEYQCKKCSFSQEKLFPDGKEYADPAQCMYCNP